MNICFIPALMWELTDGPVGLKKKIIESQVDRGEAGRLPEVGEGCPASVSTSGKILAVPLVRGL